MRATAQDRAGWMARLMLLAAGLLYVLIGSKFVLDPEAAGAESGYRFAAAVARTNLRAGVGGFPLGVAAALLYCAASPARTLAGLKLAAGVTGVVLAIRLASAANDGVVGDAAKLLAPESIVTVLTGTTALLLARRNAAKAGGDTGI
ncbi:DUF4345 family protein [Phenylobacterium sp.]|uniref:DUF4345 family protein n=1 Tax=Phenylobacterium sp. TaxID=1871053 RepID=UPI00263557C1|nr:DUF4345 family protein [Phenylobacterium sp.]